MAGEFPSKQNASVRLESETTLIGCAHFKCLFHHSKPHQVYHLAPIEIPHRNTFDLQ